MNKTTLLILSLLITASSAFSMNTVHLYKTSGHPDCWIEYNLGVLHTGLTFVAGDAQWYVGEVGDITQPVQGNPVIWIDYMPPKGTEQHLWYKTTQWDNGSVIAKATTDYLISIYPH